MSKPVSSALARKLSATQRGTMTASRAVLRALRLALARSAVEGFRLAVSVIGAKQAGRKAEDLTEGLDEGWLFLLVAAGEERLAAVALDPGLVSAVIQQQTIGEVLPDPPEPRPFTDTDAAIVAPLIDGMFARATELLEDPQDVALLSGYEYVSRAADLRAVSLALVQEAYARYELTVELGRGARQGVAVMLLPDPSDDSVPGDARTTPAEKRLAEAAGIMRVELNAVITRLQLPLAELSGLSAGDVLPLTGARLGQIDVLSIDRARVATGRLGQCGGMRALRLTGKTVNPSVSAKDAGAFVEHVGNRVGPGNSVSEPVEGGASESAHDILVSETSVSELDHDDLDSVGTDQLAEKISELSGLPVTRSSS